jgi:hypothetical protein
MPVWPRALTTSPFEGARVLFTENTSRGARYAPVGEGNTGHSPLIRMSGVASAIFLRLVLSAPSTEFFGAPSARLCAVARAASMVSQGPLRRQECSPHLTEARQSEDYLVDLVRVRSTLFAARLEGQAPDSGWQWDRVPVLFRLHLDTMLTDQDCDREGTQYRGQLQCRTAVIRFR